MGLAAKTGSAAASREKRWDAVWVHSMGLNQQISDAKIISPSLWKHEYCL